MPPTVDSPPDTLADALRAIGDVPLHRILWNPRPGTATVDDVLRLADGEPKLLAELVDDTLVLKAIDRDVLTDCCPHLITLADVIDGLGGIPLDRILWTPFPGTATVDDAVRLIDGDDKRLVELFDGILVEKPMGLQESFLASWLITCLNQFVVPRRLGMVGGADALLRLFGQQARLPDVSFFPWASLPAGGSRARVGTVAPALAVEVLSPSNTRAEMDRKRREYFAAGTLVVWMVDPRTETVAMFTDPTTSTTLTTTDTLDGGAVLPGFALPVADIFAYLDPPTP